MPKGPAPSTIRAREGARPSARARDRSRGRRTSGARAQRADGGARAAAQCELGERGEAAPGPRVPPRSAVRRFRSRACCRAQATNGSASKKNCVTNVRSHAGAREPTRSCRARRGAAPHRRCADGPPDVPPRRCPRCRGARARSASQRIERRGERARGGDADRRRSAAPGAPPGRSAAARRDPRGRPRSRARAPGCAAPGRSPRAAPRCTRRACRLHDLARDEAHEDARAGAGSVGTASRAARRRAT